MVSNSFRDVIITFSGQNTSFKIHASNYYRDNQLLNFKIAGSSAMELHRCKDAASLIYNNYQKIYIIATFDTKSQEANFLKNIISSLNLPVLSVDISTTHHNSNADIKAFEVAKFHPQGATAVFCGDRGKAITAMGIAFKEFVKSHDDIGAMLGIGGSGGTSMICEGMQALAIGIPKLMLSTMASQDISPYIGGSDIAMLYSVTDFVNINSISSKILANAAGAIAGAFTQATHHKQALKTLPAIGITMFGVTTPCVESITNTLKNDYDCLVFHATGAGGKSMEKLLDSGFFAGIIDLTTTEVCDYLFGGVLACTQDRFDAIARTQKPAIISCGALDMINFGAFDTVPQQFKNRLLYKHNPEVTLMRTNIEENTKIGEWIANKINACHGEISFIIPEGGISALDAEAQPFWDPKANAALFSAISKNLHVTNKRKLIKAPYHINSPEFSQLVAEQFNRLLSKLAAESEVQGDSERRTAVYASVHEDSSTESTQQFASAVEFRKKSNAIRN